jgi:hypothetical protein
VRHRLDECLLLVAAVVELLPEPEDHQQRVVDRHAEADQRDEELDDERHVGHVGQRVDGAEGGQDRDRRRHQRHGDRRQRAEDEEQHEQRADAADQNLDENARPAAAADVLLQRVAAREVRRHARWRVRLRRRTHRLDVQIRGEPGLAGAVDLRESRVTVLRDVGARAGREE